ncbi:hypothetical protein ABKN59_009871 [Abortiporus biennis]
MSTASNAVFSVSSGSDRNGGPCIPVAWKVWTFQPNKECEEVAVISYDYRIATANVGHQVVREVDLNSAGVSLGDQYMSLDNDMRWKSYRLLNGLDGIVAVNRSGSSQNFVVGTMTRRYGFEAFSAYKNIGPQAAVTFQIPTILQIYRTHGCEVGKLLSDISQLPTLIQPISLPDMQEDIHFHLYTDESGIPVLERVDTTNCQVEYTVNTRQELTTEFVGELPTPPMEPVNFEISEEIKTPAFGPPLFTPPLTPEPELLDSPLSDMGTPDFLPMDDSDDIDL